MSTRARSATVLWAALFALLGAAPSGALDPADKCVVKKMKESGKYVFCLMKAEAKGVIQSLPADVSRCDSKLTTKWTAIESAAGGACPTDGDVEVARDIGIADAGLLVGTVSASARFQDNGNGTLTDVNTGLTWEKKSYLDGSVHDINEYYAWNNIFVMHLAELNGTNFGGYDDWRAPTVKEMVTLINFTSTADVKGYPEFDVNCTTGCDVLTCSCAFSDIWGAETYWTSQNNPDDPSEAIGVRTYPVAIEMEEDKSGSGAHPVIAVRGGRRSD